MKSSLLFSTALLLGGGAALPALAQETAAPATSAPAQSATPAHPAAPAQSATPGQTAPAQPATPAQSAAPAQPGAPATAAAPGTFTDAELVGFANAAIEADKIQKDATIAADAKQAQMLAAVQAQGLDPARYNQIAQATRSDPELVKKIQELAAAKMASEQNTANP